MHRHALTDDQWKRIEPLVPRRAQGRKSERGDRSFVDAVLYRAKTGVPWRDLPERFGPWKTVYNRFSRWANKDVWVDVFRASRINVDDTASMGDASVVRAHQDASGGKGGSNRTRWAARVEDSPPRSTRSLTRKAGLSTSRSPRASATR